MAKDLQATIRQLVDAFTQGILTAVRAASLHELENDGPKPRAERPARVSRRAPVKQRRQGKPRAEVAVGADVLLDTMVETARRFPAGLKSEEFRATLKLENKNLFRRVASEAVDAGLLRRTGEKRTTTYFPA